MHTNNFFLTSAPKSTCQEILGSGGFSSKLLIKLVNEIAKFQSKSTNKTKSYFIQINIGKEVQKSGVDPDDLKELYDFCIEKRLYIVGLMCIPPSDKHSEYYFNEMRRLRDNLDKNLSLSMGMSGDYKISLECGSNLIRVGSKIFS